MPLPRGNLLETSCGSKNKKDGSADNELVKNVHFLVGGPAILEELYGLIRDTTKLDETLVFKIKLDAKLDF